jgi:hypothetical protein
MNKPITLEEFEDKVLQNQQDLMRYKLDEVEALKNQKACIESQRELLLETTIAQIPRANMDAMMVELNKVIGQLDMNIAQRGLSIVEQKELTTQFEDNKNG